MQSMGLIEYVYVVLGLSCVFRVNMKAIEITIHNLISSGMDPKTENNAYLGFIYTSFQERATKVTTSTAPMTPAHISLAWLTSHSTAQHSTLTAYTQHCRPQHSSATEPSSKDGASRACASPKLAHKVFVTAQAC